MNKLKELENLYENLKLPLEYTNGKYIFSIEREGKLVIHNIEHGALRLNESEVSTLFSFLKDALKFE